MSLTTQAERADAILMLAAVVGLTVSHDREGRNRQRIDPAYVALAMSSEDTAALIDFAADEGE